MLKRCRVTEELLFCLIVLCFSFSILRFCLMIFICLCSVTMKVTFWEHFTLFMFVCAHCMNIYPFFVYALGLTQMNLRLYVSRHIEFDKESLIFKCHIQYTPTNTLRLIITLFNTSHIITLKLYKVLKLCFT